MVGGSDEKFVSSFFVVDFWVFEVDVVLCGDLSVFFVDGKPLFILIQGVPGKQLQLYLHVKNLKALNSDFLDNSWTIFILPFFIKFIVKTQENDFVIIFYHVSTFLIM